MRKKILIHSIAFSPDGVSTAYLYNDIALKFSSSNYEVVVLTTTPHYNIVPEQMALQPLKAKFGGLYYESFYHHIRVIHVPQKKFKSALLRILGFVYWHILSFFIGIFQKNISVILSPSPPLTIGLINILIGKLKSAKVIYNVQEIYPDFLINQGQLKIKPVITFLKWLERFVYNHSAATTTIDKVFYETIVGRFKDPGKLHIIPNFVDTTLFKPIRVEEQLNQSLFPKKEGVLKLMYAGNIGHAQNWQPLLLVAKELIQTNVEFWVIGEGVMKDFLITQIEKLKLTNIHVVPYQPRDLMPALIAYADLHFIFMSPEMEGQGFPSKVYSIMACSKPLMVTSGKNTPISNFLTPIGCACVINQPSLKEKCMEIIAFINKASGDPGLLKTMGEKGFSCIQEKYTKEAVTTHYVELANNLIEQ